MSPTAQLALTAGHIALAIVVSAHVVLTKDDVRGALGWVGLIWLTPLVGSILYAVFGINRIRRQAGRRRPRERRALATAEHQLPSSFGEALSPLGGLARLVGGVTALPITEHNRVDPLANGDEAYPAMLDAIGAATRSVALSTYIFDHGEAGDAFVEALAAAVARGVEVRVLVDAVGVRYGRPPITRALRHHHVRVASFLPSLLPLSQRYVNLRNHRKLLIVDGATGFVGGMNIRDACLLRLGRHDATRDLHFRMCGPVVGQLLAAFAEDWSFTTGETLDGAAWADHSMASGDVHARGVPDGPDEHLETLPIVLQGAIAAARRSVRIMTPYFLPDAPILDALRVASLRGVRVDLVIPERGNLRMVNWAMRARLPRLLRWNVRVHQSPAPFDHTKLLTIDGSWSLVGSANWDPRSLRLNFEYCVECYGDELAGELDRVIDARIAEARPLNYDEFRRRPLALRLRDGVAWLAQPYL